MPRLASLLTLSALVLAPLAPAAAGGRRGEARMVSVPAGSYRPLYGRRDDPPTRVAGFRIDRDPVTRGDYLEFVRDRPEWRRSAVRALFANRAGYLADWRGDLFAGDAPALRQPVTGVSWFAAQ
jgi:sulfatase modifying factor 1